MGLQSIDRCFLYFQPRLFHGQDGGDEERLISNLGRYDSREAAEQGGGECGGHGNEVRMRCNVNHSIDRRRARDLTGKAS